MPGCRAGFAGSRFEVKALRAGWSGHGGKGPQPGEDLGEQAVAAREAQDQVAGTAGQPAGNGDEPAAEDGDHDFAAADAVAREDVHATVATVNRCSRAAMLAATRARHIQALLTWG